MPRDRRAVDARSAQSPENPDNGAAEVKWSYLTDTGSMEPSPEAIAWQRRADAWAQQSDADQGQTVEPASRWSDAGASGRPTFPADGVGWRTETAEWRATGARWRQTTEWRSPSGTHGWRSTTEAWQTTGGGDTTPPGQSPSQQPAISSNAWPTPAEAPEGMPSWRQQPADSRWDGSPSADTRWTDSRPADSRPVDSRQADSRPVDSPPADSRWTDSRSADSGPADSRWTDSRSADSRSAGQQFAGPAEPTLPGAGPSWRPSAENPRQQPADRPRQQPTGSSWEQPAESSWRQPVEGSWQQPVEGSWRQPTEDSWRQPAEDSRRQPTEDSWRQPADDSWRQPADDSWRQRPAQDRPSWQAPADDSASWQQPASPRPAAEPPSWSAAAQRSAAPSWRRDAIDGSATWTDPAATRSAPTPPSAAPSWIRTEDPIATPSWQSPRDDGRHLVREDDRAAWRRGAEIGESSQQVGRRRAPENGSRTSGGTGWATNSDADNWAGHTDTGSIPVFTDPETPTWGVRSEATPRTEQPGRRALPAGPDDGQGRTPRRNRYAHETPDQPYGAGPSRFAEDARALDRRPYAPDPGYPAEPAYGDGTRGGVAPASGFAGGGRRAAPEPAYGDDEGVRGARSGRLASGAERPAPPRGPADEQARSRRYARSRDDWREHTDSWAAEPDTSSWTRDPDTGQWSRSDDDPRVQAWRREAARREALADRDGPGKQRELPAGPWSPGTADQAVSREPDGGRPGDGRRSRHDHASRGGLPADTPPYGPPAEDDPVDPRRQPGGGTPYGSATPHDTAGRAAPYESAARSTPFDNGTAPRSAMPYDGDPTSPRSAIPYEGGPTSPRSAIPYEGGPTSPRSAIPYEGGPTSPRSAIPYEGTARVGRRYGPPDTDTPGRGASGQDARGNGGQPNNTLSHGGAPTSGLPYGTAEGGGHRTAPEAPPAGRRRAANPAYAEPADSPAYRREPHEYRRPGTAEDYSRADPTTESRQRLEPGAWQRAEREEAARSAAGYREGGTGDWRRELIDPSDLAEGESRRYGTSDFVPFRSSGSAAVPGASNLSMTATTSLISSAAPETGHREREAPARSQRSGNGFQASAAGSYERRPVSGGLTSSRRSNLLDPDDAEDDQESGGPLAVVGYTVVWYGVPVVLFAFYMLVMNSGARSHALDTLGKAAPQFLVSLVLSVLVALGLRFASSSWKAISVGLAAAVVGGGLATVLTSAITGNSLS
jgi:hypothetical protein